MEEISRVENSISGSHVKATVYIAPGFVAQAYLSIHLYIGVWGCMCTPDVMCGEPFLPWLVDSNILVCMQIFLVNYRPHVDTWFETTFWSAVKQHCSY